MEILVFTNQRTSRKQYCFKQVCYQILGFRVRFTTKIEEFISYQGVKFSYAKKPLGQELFVEAAGLLDEEGFGDFDIKVEDWNSIPCFFKVSKESSIPFDIFSASFYLLVRYEEYLPFVKNKAGGFPVEESTAFKYKFLHRPVVDLWAYQFLEVLQEKYPNIEFPQSTYTIQLQVTVHEAFAFRYKGLLRQLVGFFKQLLSGNLPQAWLQIKTQLRLVKDPLDVYDKIVQLAKKHQFNLKMFFQLSDFSKDNRNINHHKTHYQHLIKSMGDYFETGLLPGKTAIFEAEQLQKEKKRWKEIAKQEVKRVLVKKFPLSFPESYINFEKALIKEDYSMGYADELGFRAGSCTPFLFYNLNAEEVTPLKIHPFALHSSILRNKQSHEIQEKLTKIKSDLQAVNGSFNLNFENEDFKSEQFTKTKEFIIQLHATD
ncbi:polysaccharide deacetylase family protein [Psychroflexus salis]|uniref:DUF7033 domain-containing protein n=1 Tax=Psychroflexus salis TaxID=1526574 RepID=A0A916ZNH1_9FLAO|nr:polysaccharide deacetylase family protein [Psychroflexus salis]GGE04346.1 hypothetical protein GCM10010831_02410 [Psychroflexus salis]